MSENKKMNSEELKNVAGGSDVGVLATHPFKWPEPHGTVTNRCRKCRKQYEERWCSYKKVVTPGICPECKEKERLEKQKD